MSPMSLVNCTSPQAPHPSQVPMPTELCPPFGDKYKPITTINNNNHYNDNQFCCPIVGGNNELSNTNDQGNSIENSFYSNQIYKILHFRFLGDQNQHLVHQLSGDRFH